MTATHCNTLQHTVTHCNTLQHTTTHCNTLQHTSRIIRRRATGQRRWGRKGVSCATGNRGDQNRLMYIYAYIHILLGAAVQHSGRSRGATLGAVVQHSGRLSAAVYYTVFETSIYVCMYYIYIYTYIHILGPECCTAAPRCNEIVLSVALRCLLQKIEVARIDLWILIYMHILHITQRRVICDVCMYMKIHKSWCNKTTTLREKKCFVHNSKLRRKRA